MLAKPQTAEGPEPNKRLVFRKAERRTKGWGSAARASPAGQGLCRGRDRRAPGSESEPAELLFNMCSCESGCSYRNYC